MPVVQVTLTEGRTPEQLRAMISGITSALVDTGVARPEQVRVAIIEIPKTHFAAADVTLAEKAAKQAAEQGS
ncbi:MAG: tautomerase family protein [Propionibacteriaceae bacterium]|nr:tautomerase family protein [Propionibacteriaceae bacterium]